MSQADIDAIRQLHSDWNAAVEAGNVDGYVAVLDEDIELIPAGAPPIRGRENYRAFLANVFVDDVFKIHAQGPAEIEVAGDLAYARYDYVIDRRPRQSDDLFNPRRQFLDILKRQADGSWRVSKHIWNYAVDPALP